MKVIFLDIDGVLNSEEYAKTDEFLTCEVDPSCMLHLYDIVKQTGAVIVLSSTWRRYWEKDKSLIKPIGKHYDEMFSRFGLHIYDKTPLLGREHTRKEEISDWLKSHPETESFVILDDGTDGWGEHADRWVQTYYNNGRGLEKQHAGEAINILLGL